eukprot:scaffold7243_cov394-Prasinococcus_capsulatus_cf.AAC.16
MLGRCCMRDTVRLLLFLPLKGESWNSHTYSVTMGAGPWTQDALVRVERSGRWTNTHQGVDLLGGKQSRADLDTLADQRIHTPAPRCTPRRRDMWQAANAHPRAGCCLSAVNIQLPAASVRENRPGDKRERVCHGCRPVERPPVDVAATRCELHHRDACADDTALGEGRAVLIKARSRAGGRQCTLSVVTDRLVQYCGVRQQPQQAMEVVSQCAGVGAS